MKSVICVAFLLTVFVTLSFAGVSRGQFKDPKHPGNCTIDENLTMFPGEVIKDPSIDCGQIICEDDDGNAQFQTCGVQKIEGCILGDYLNKSLPYPQCCRRKWICVE